MRPNLTLIQGGLRKNETLLSKLMNRPDDFPEAIFQRALKKYEGRLSFIQMVSILKLRAQAAHAKKNPPAESAEGF